MTGLLTTDMLDLTPGYGAFVLCTLLGKTLLVKGWDEPADCQEFGLRRSNNIRPCNIYLSFLCPLQQLGNSRP
jgi:hypothetical protein